MTNQHQKSALAEIRGSKYLAYLTMLSQHMPKAEIKRMCAKAGALTKDEQVAVMEAELRQRGYPVGGDRKQDVAIPQAVKPVAEKVAADAPLSVTASAWLRMSADEKQNFGASNGVIHVDEFNKLNPAQKSALCKSGARSVDTLTAPAAVKPAAQNASSVSRAQFELMTPAERMAFVKAGKTVAE